ncbi:MAG: hypothetical protein ACJ0GE_05135 [Candidatus Actinomarina sp.]|jgi:hypothetical protein|tara:strand:- start:652 stop:1035 length:384 start_codon:yes stop_codon:yes gene_type:complete
MKNLLYLLVGIGFLAIISSSASGFLTSETSSTLDGLYEESFYIDPENIEISDDVVKIYLLQINKNNGEKKVNDCLNFYSSEYENYKIECSISVNENIAFDDECVFITGVFIKEEEKDVVTIVKDNSC